VIMEPFFRFKTGKTGALNTFAGAVFAARPQKEVSSFQKKPKERKKNRGKEFTEFRIKGIYF